MRATFFLPGEDDLEGLRRLDPDRDVHELVTGERVWILQTYLRLAAAGQPVELADRPPETESSSFTPSRSSAAAALVAMGRLCPGWRARRPQRVSPGGFRGAAERSVGGRPHPLLLAAVATARPDAARRRARRADRARRVQGLRGQPPPGVTAPAFTDALRGRGLELVGDAVEYGGAATDTSKLRWADYSDIDLVVAVRPPVGSHTGKPASKLYNAWRAGVPALLGPEPAYRELRTDPLDYIEVGSVDEALAAIDRLRADPSLYRRMVERGRERAVAFSPEAVLEQWVDLLWRRDPGAFGRSPLAIGTVLDPAGDAQGQRLLEGRPAR